MFVPAIYLFRFALAWDRRWWILASLTVALVMQPILVVVAARTFFSMPPTPDRRIKLIGSFVYALLLFGLFWSIYSPVPRYIRNNEHFALKYLASCASSAFLDAFQHSGYYPQNFSNLTPNANPKCTDSGPCALNPTNPSHGYFFEYVGTRPELTQDGCIRFKSFTMTARPVVFGQTGIRSFLLDEFERIHVTAENRPSNTSDPIDLSLLSEHRP
jgi:hypothetical protein